MEIFTKLGRLHKLVSLTTSMLTFKFSNFRSHTQGHGHVFDFLLDIVFVDASMNCDISTLVIGT